MTEMVDITLIQYLLAIISGIAVGFSLGLIGGGGSILAVPLFIYFVGINHPHLAIGTTALAVGLTSFINFYQHFKRKNVNFRIAPVFAFVGGAGVLLGAFVGLTIKGGELLFFFSLLMIVIGIFMYTSKCRLLPDEGSRDNAKKTNYPKVSAFGILVGFASGFFGIGGGFLIVPALLSSSKIKIGMAIGTSLFAVGTFGIVTSMEYSLSGQVLYLVAIVYVIGGIIGGFFGTKLSVGMNKKLLRKIFALIVVAVGIYVAISSYPALIHVL